MCQKSQLDGRKTLIVFGELQEGKWMAGSDFYKRTDRAQDKYAPETADSRTMVQMAILQVIRYRVDNMRKSNNQHISPEESAIPWKRAWQAVVLCKFAEKGVAVPIYVGPETGQVV